MAEFRMEKANPFLSRIAKQIILEWNAGRHPIDRVFSEAMREHRVGSQQRPLLAEATYSLVRYWPSAMDAQFRAEDPKQMRELDEVLNEILCGRLTREKLLRNHERGKPPFEKSNREHLRGFHGMPEFFLSEMGGREEAWHEALHDMLEEAPLFVRANRLHPDHKRFTEFYPNAKACGILPEAYVFPERQSFGSDEHHRAGLFEVQDLHSQIVGFAAAPQPGESVLDYCAGAGGKSLHMAALMGNEGEVWAHDTRVKPLQALEERAERAGASCIKTATSLSTKRKFDVVLVDAPCSSLGTLRRNPDRLQRFTEKEASSLHLEQKTILSKAAEFLKPNGRLIYATCTMRGAENFQVVHSVFPEANLMTGRLREVFAGNIALQEHIDALKASAFGRLSGFDGASPDADWVQLGPSRRISNGLRGDAFFLARVK